MTVSLRVLTASSLACSCFWFATTVIFISLFAWSRTTAQSGLGGCGLQAEVIRSDEPPAADDLLFVYAFREGGEEYEIIVCNADMDKKLVDACDAAYCENYDLHASLTELEADTRRRRLAVTDAEWKEVVFSLKKMVKLLPERVQPRSRTTTYRRGQNWISPQELYNLKSKWD